MKEFGFYNDFDENLMLNEQIEINGEDEYILSDSNCNSFILGNICKSAKSSECNSSL